MGAVYSPRKTGFGFSRNAVNPSIKCSGVLSMTFGMALMLQSLFVFALCIIYHVPVLKILSAAESQLLEAFDEEYRSYCRKVKRLVPFIY